VWTWATHCNTLQYTATTTHLNILQLQHILLQTQDRDMWTWGKSKTYLFDPCKTLQRTSICCNYNTLKHTAITKNTNTNANTGRRYVDVGQKQDLSLRPMRSDWVGTPGYAGTTCVLQCVAVCWALQRVVVNCSVLQCVLRRVNHVFVRTDRCGTRQYIDFIIMYFVALDH